MKIGSVAGLPAEHRFILDSRKSFREFSGKALAGSQTRNGVSAFLDRVLHYIDRCVSAALMCESAGRLSAAA